MKKTITIPVNKIAGAILYSSGIAGGVIVDNALKKETTGNKYVDIIGRSAIISTINVTMSALAMYIAQDDTFDIKIKVPKKRKKGKDNKFETKVDDVNNFINSKQEELKRKTEKDHAELINKVSNRSEKAADAWDKIMDFLRMTHIGEETKLKKSYVDEFNHQMKKISKKVGFIYEELKYSKDPNEMVDIINSNIDNILDHFREIYKFCTNEDPKYLVDDEEESEDIDGSVTTDEEFTVDHEDDLIMLLTKNNIDPSDLDSEKFSEIYNKFYLGEISGIEACERVIAILSDEEHKDEVEEYEPISEKVEAPVEVEMSSNDVVNCVEEDVIEGFEDRQRIWNKFFKKLNASKAKVDQMYLCEFSYRYETMDDKVIHNIIMDYLSNKIGAQEAYDLMKKHFVNSEE